MRRKSMQKPLTLLTLAQVEGRSGLKKSKLYDLIAAGEFPRPVRIGAASRWVEAEVEDALARYVFARDATPPRGLAARPKDSARRPAPSARDAA
jgi:prophage regulatory protein